MTNYIVFADRKFSSKQFFKNYIISTFIAYPVQSCIPGDNVLYAMAIKEQSEWIEKENAFLNCFKFNHTDFWKEKSYSKFKMLG